MKEEKIYQMALAEAVFSIISWNEYELTPDQIFKAWQKGEEPQGVQICETFQDYDPDYLAEECESKTSQFISFAKEILKEANK